MGREVNVDLIQALEKQIEKGDGDIIKLKRARNSLLNISTRIPPEILEHIFAWSVFRKEDHSLRANSHFDRPREGSYNFRLVCHHWSEVASNIPELWSFWGTTLWQWWNRRSHPRFVPRIDLVLADSEYAHFSNDKPLYTLRDRAAQDAIRQVHLKGEDDLLSSVLSSLTPSENVRCNSIESIDLQNYGDIVDVSDFFARHRLPKLRSLFLNGIFRLPSWDHLIPQTTLLTTLSLDIPGYLAHPPPSTLQLLSILASNPNLRELLMDSPVIPVDDGDGSTPQVSLPHLKNLHFTGELRGVFRLLDRLALPDTLEYMELKALDSTVEDLSRIPGPYLREFFQRDHDRLGVKAYTDDSLLDTLLINVVTVGQPRSRQLKFDAVLDRIGPPSSLDNPCLNIIASIPGERVVSLSTNVPSEKVVDVLDAMPNIKMMYLMIPET